MVYKVSDFIEYFNEFAPYSTKMDFDNVGHLAGFSGDEVTKILLSLDITDNVIDEAKEFGAQLIVSHHPLFFGIKKVSDSDLNGAKAAKILRSGMNAICLHTNMDAAWGGVNDALMSALGAEVTGLLEAHCTYPDGSPCGISRVGVMKCSLDMKDFLPLVKKNLHANGLRYHDAGKIVKNIACCGGSGGSDLVKAYEAGCDTFVTSDIKYDQFLLAAELGINLIDADHFCTENVVIPVIYERLRKDFPELSVKISEVHHQTAQFFC